MEEKLERVVSGVLKREVRFERDRDASLRDLGLASLRMIQLIGDLEAAFAIRIDDAEVEPENFDTLGVLLSFVERKASA